MPPPGWPPRPPYGQPPNPYGQPYPPVSVDLQHNFTISVTLTVISRSPDTLPNRRDTLLRAPLDTRHQANTHRSLECTFRSPRSRSRSSRHSNSSPGVRRRTSSSSSSISMGNRLLEPRLTVRRE